MCVDCDGDLFEQGYFSQEAMSHRSSMPMMDWSAVDKKKGGGQQRPKTSSIDIIHSQARHPVFGSTRKVRRL